MLGKGVDESGVLRLVISIGVLGQVPVGGLDAVDHAAAGVGHLRLDPRVISVAQDAIGPGLHPLRRHVNAAAGRAGYEAPGVGVDGNAHALITGFETVTNEGVDA